MSEDRTLTGPQEPTPERVAAVRTLRAVLAGGEGTPEGVPAGDALSLSADDDRVMSGLIAAQELSGVDLDYLRHVDAVSDRGIAAASLADLGTLFTYVLRGERFSEGHIRAAIATGKVARMLDRLAEWVPETR